MGKTPEVTLLECFTALILTSLLLILALPSWHFLVTRAEMSAQVNQLLSEIALARTEAIKRKTSVILCKSQDGLTCEGEWSQGQMLLAEGKVINVFKSLNKEGELRWEGLTSEDYLQFMPWGGLKAMNGKFIYRLKGEAVEIIINVAGRARVQQLQ